MFLFAPPLIVRPSRIIPGAINYTSPGTYSLKIPDHHNIYADVRGAGAGGGGCAAYNEGGGFPIATPGASGASGGYSYFINGIIDLTGGGGGAGGGAPNPSANGSNGGHGGGSGGTSNITAGGAGGGGPGALRYTFDGSIINYGGTGGYGGRAIRTYVRGTLPVGKTVTIIVGSAGGPGTNGYLQSRNYAYAAYPGWGGHGAVYISWD